jgi:hypothetical protein
MAFTERTIAATWLTVLGVFALTVAATLWKRAAEAQRVSQADAHDLMRMDSDMG